MDESFADCLTRARAELLRAQRLLAEEIRAYPTPISGCDAQFNHLIAERSRIAAALTALGREVFVPTPRTPAPAASLRSTPTPQASRSTRSIPRS